MLKGEAELELDELSDDRYDHPDGIQSLLDDLEPSFGERELFRQGGIIREFEGVGRLQGESVTAFVRRFRLLERKLADNKVPPYPEEARVIKLLDGLRLDEKSTSSLLLAAGNKYNMKLIQDAIKIQYPAGMSVTGIPNKSAQQGFRRPVKGKSRWSAWHADWDDYDPDENDVPEYDQGDQAAETYGDEEAAAPDDVEYEYDEDDGPAAAAAHDEALEASPSSATYEDVINAVNALTVTSKRLAEITKGRGFFSADPKQDGKSKGKYKSDDRGKSKGRGKSSSKSGGKSSSKSNGKGKGKPSPTPSRQNLDLQQQRLASSTCLGCGSNKHWLRDCPSVSRHNAQLTTAGCVLDGQGSIVSSSWMTSHQMENVPSFQLPPLCEGSEELSEHGETPEVYHLTDVFHEAWEQTSESCFAIPPNPRVLLQYADHDTALMIADTGCQRQVAGRAWHLKRQNDILPLQPQQTSEACHFSFGPNQGEPSTTRFAYPVGVGGVFAVFGISVVESKAPALFSRPAFASLGAIPDIVAGVMHYTALGCDARLWLSPCGHLAIRIDEWPEDCFSWPPACLPRTIPDAWCPSAAEFKSATLVRSTAPSEPPPHAKGPDSNMAAALASAADPPDGVPLLRGTSGPPLCGSVHEAGDQGQSSSAVLSTSDQHHNAFNGNCDVGPDSQPRGKVCESAGKLPTSFRPEVLRGRRTEGQNLRPVRVEMGGQSKGPHDNRASSSQGISDGKDSFVSESEVKSRKLFGKFGWLTTAISALLASALGIDSSGHVQSCLQSGASPSSAGTSGSLLYLPEVRFGTDGCGDRHSSSTLGGHSGERLDVPAVRLGERGGQLAGRDGPGGGYAGRHGSLGPRSPRSPRSVGAGHGWVGDSYSADLPMLAEDEGSYLLKSGTRKRLSGNVKQLRQMFSVENKIYEARTLRARSLRRYGADIIEIYAGMGNITAEALEQGLRAVQPIDAVHGISLESRADFQQLRCFLKQRRPFLTVWEIRCDPWSNINHLNYDQAQLQVIRDEQRLSLEEMRITIEEMKAEFDGHFLLENPWGTPFWQQPDIMKIQQLPGAELRKGSMCRFGLRGRQGKLLQKNTGWCSDLPLVLDEICLTCNHNNSAMHEPCLGGNSKRAQVYTRQLAKALIQGLMQSLKQCGDERWMHHFAEDHPSTWTCGLDVSQPFHDHRVWATMWDPTMSSAMGFEVYYVDIIRNEEVWRPILQEVRLRLEGKVSNSAIVKKGTAFFEQIQALVPWTIHQAQIVKSPKVRRLPQIINQLPITHRAAILQHTDGRMTFETEEVQSFATGAAAKFSNPVSFGILVYGEAPATSLDPEENNKPENSKPLTPALGDVPKQQPSKPSRDVQPEVAPEETMYAWQPGYYDISFSVSDEQVPKWCKAVLRRMHTNLGHPSNEALTRLLAQSGAAGQALLGAKHLKCSVCERTRPPRQPRPSKLVFARRFNDRLFMDIVYIKNVAGTTFPFLNMLDDASTYQVLDLLPDRSEETVIRVLVKGWFKFFGHPDFLVLDAEGSFRGMSFETLMSQCNIQIRYVPPDAHYQLGKCERHGQTAKWMMQRLVSQFAAHDAEEMEILANMTTFAKNTLTRRSGASPCQWVFGRQPRIPAALLSEPEAVEAKQMLDSSDALRQIEAVRHEAMKSFLDFEFSDALRKAMLRKGRPWRGPIEVGQQVAYYRHRNQADGEGTVEGYRQGLVIGLDPGPSGSVWLRNNRGRVVQASREQIRAVVGEELWSPDTDDIKALRDSELDLSRKHALAFDHRAPGPTSADDRHATEALDAQGQPLALADQAGPSVVPVPVFAPSTEATTEPSPDVSRRSSTTAPTAPSAAVPQTPVIYLPPTPALPAIQEEDEPNPTRSGSKITTEGDTSLLKLADGPLALDDRRQSASSARAASSPRGPSLKRETTSTESELPPVRQAKLPAEQGTKRIAEEPVEALARQDRQTRMQEPASASAQHVSRFSVFPLYCKECGTKPDISSPDAVQCARCFHHEFVNDPILVSNWFDEVEERDAMSQQGRFHYDKYYKRWIDYDPAHVGRPDLPKEHEIDDHLEAETYITGVGQMFNAMPEKTDNSSAEIWSVAVKDKEEKNDWQWWHVFENIAVHPDSVQGNFLDTAHKKIFLRHGQHHDHQVRAGQPDERHHKRHARHCSHITGWDGSPPELQPAFQHSAFATAYHAACHEVAHGRLEVDDEVKRDMMNDLEYDKLISLDEIKHNYPVENAQVFTTSTDEVLFNADSSDDESSQTSGRAAKQALKREIPWKTIPKQDWPSFIEALKEEWREWELWSSCKPVLLREDINPQLIMKSRVCFRWKPKDGGKWFKAKARIVIQGYRDPHLPLLTRDAPVLARTSFMLILQWAACHNVSLFNGDCKSAFLQGLPDTERPTAIYMRPPQDDLSLEVNPQWRNKKLVYQLSAPVYGQANAPRRWFLYVVQVLQGLNWHQHSLDPCLFLQRSGDKVVAVLGLHVDDIIIACLPEHESLLEEVKAAFTWGSEWEKDDFVFIGRRISRTEDGGVALDQTHYVADIVKTKITKDPSEKLMNHPELVTEFRSGIGSLQWLSGTTRGDLAPYVSMLQKAHSELTVADLVAVNKVLKYVKATANAYVKIVPLDLQDVAFYAYGDSGFANAPGNKSQGGYVISMASKRALQQEERASLLEWKSYRHQRALRSTLAAEAAALDRAQDMGNFLACVFSEMTDASYRATQARPNFEVIPITDARSLWDSIHRLSTSFAEKRVEIDIAGLRETCRNLRWVPTEKQMSDAMTKMCPKLRDSFRRWMMSPIITLVDSRCADDDASERPNEAWRLNSQKKSLAVTFSSVVQP